MEASNSAGIVSHESQWSKVWHASSWPCRMSSCKSSGWKISPVDFCWPINPKEASYVPLKPYCLSIAPPLINAERGKSSKVNEITGDSNWIRHGRRPNHRAARRCKGGGRCDESLSVIIAKTRKSRTKGESRFAACLRFFARCADISSTSNRCVGFWDPSDDLRLLTSDSSPQRQRPQLAVRATFPVQTPSDPRFPQVRQSPAHITVPRAPGALLQMDAKISELMPGALITNIFREQNRDVLCQMWIFGQRTRHHSWTGGKRHKKNIPNRSGNTLHHLVGPTWFPDKAEAVFNECTDESVLRSSAKTVVSHLPIHTIGFTQESVDR